MFEQLCGHSVIKQSAYNSNNPLTHFFNLFQNEPFQILPEGKKSCHLSIDTALSEKLRSASAITDYLL